MKNLADVLNNSRAIAIFLVLAVFVTVIFGSIYMSIQQVYRANANDPQVEVVGQVADVVNQNVPLDAIVSDAEQIDMGKSLSLFVMVFDADKQLAGSSAGLDDQVPTPPTSVFDAADGVEDYRFTWEPKEGVRIAAIMSKIGDKGYVLAGRSLQEIESRESALRQILIIGWAVCILLSSLLSLIIKPRQTLAIIEETNVTVVEENPNPDQQ